MTGQRGDRRRPKGTLAGTIAATALAVFLGVVCACGILSAVLAAAGWTP